MALGRLVAESSGPEVTVVVAHTRDERRALAADIFANAFLPVLLVVLVAAGLIWFGVRRALAPLLTIERLVGEREPGDLTPIVAPAPAEVRQLLAGLNRFMERLQATLALMQSFLADAAHQVRTPLATLRAQAELAVEEDDPAALRRYVHKIHRNAALASQVTNQLLSHTMVSHRGQVASREPVDLVVLLRQVAQRAEAGGVSPPIELDLRALTGDAMVLGDSITLREAFTNLLDNARHYAGDQYPVQIRVATTPPELVVEVADRGPGIAEAEKERVLERFTRGSAGREAAGSGLGLAIVKAAADAHRASLALLDRPGGGLIVRLAFPQLAARPPLAAAVLLVAALLAAPAVEARDGAAVSGAAARDGASADQCRRRPPADGAAPARLPGRARRHRDHLRRHADRRGLRQRRSWPGPAGPRDQLRDRPAGEAGQRRLDPAAPVGRHHARAGLGELARRGLRLHAGAGGDRLFSRGVGTGRGAAFATGPDPSPCRREPDRFRRRVATYDIDRAGVGYLFAAQDSLLAGQYWRLAIALGEATVRLFATSGEILAAVERGEVLIGYNVLGSYALARQQSGAPIGIVLPRDYTLWLSRVVVIPRGARQPVAAKLFVDHLLSPRGQAVVAATPGMRALVQAGGEAGFPPDAAASAQPITLGPALLVFLDRMKRERFMADWSAAVRQP